MINYDNYNFLNNKVFDAEILIISIKITQLFKNCLSPKKQVLKPSSMVLGFLLLITASNYKVCFVTNGFKDLCSIFYHSYLDWD